ncbi:hypothetical protein PAMA_008651 [Pampus argenteus]
MDGSNLTIDPSCRDRPPLAIDIIIKLDIFSIILYSVLTFMAAMSMLVFIEECVYIYRKVPSNKKSVIIWVNGAAPLLCRGGVQVPRTDAGGGGWRRGVSATSGETQTEDQHRAVLLLLPLSAARGHHTLKITGAAIWINPFVGILTIIALWPVAIMFMHLRTALRTLKIIPKYAMYQLVLILSQLQTAIINILALNGTIACTPPFSAASRGYMMSQQLLILEMFIITLVTRLLYRRHQSPQCIYKLVPSAVDSRFCDVLFARQV